MQTNPASPMPRSRRSSSQRTPHIATRALTAACLMVVGCTGAEPTAEDTDEVSADALLFSNSFATGVVRFAMTISSPRKTEGLSQTRGNCTASRVAERLVLTAAHCVFLDQKAELYIKSESGAQEERFELEDRLVYPATLACWKASLTPEQRAKCIYSHPDVALLRTSRPLPERFTIAPVDIRPVELGESVTQVGGGTSLNENGEPILDSKLRLGPSYVADFSWLYPVQRVGYTVKITQSVQPESQVFFAPGRNYGNQTLAQTAPGDSGGPVVRKVGSKLSVVGVHSTSGTPAQYSSEARVDDASAVGPWLAAQGVPVTRSPLPVRRRCATGYSANAALSFCVRDEDGWAPTVMLAAALRPACEADRALPSDKQPIGLSRVVSCAQKGFPVTLLHHWAFGL